MKRPSLVAALAVLMLAGAAIGSAQDLTVVNIAFSFSAGPKTLPAGRYEIRAAPDEPIVITDHKGAEVAQVPYLTRLAAPDTPLTDPKLVFDRIGDQNILSEVWLPGLDGFLVAGAPTAHTHRVLKGTKKGT